jgi:DNA-binding transcriptional ArsR family regulator
VQGESKQPRPKDPVLERALSHPKRLAMFGYLMEKRGTGTEEELVEALDLPAPRVKYHLLVLRGADLIAHIEVQGRGTADRYIATASAGL